MRLKTFFFFILIILIFVNTTVYSQTSVTVNDAIEMALENNETYLKATKELEKAKNQVSEVRASAFPQITAGLNVIHNWELPSFVIDFDGELMTLRSGTTNNLMADLTITQPIYNGGQVFTAWSIARMYKKFASNQLEMDKRQLMLDVIRAFWMAVMTKEMTRVTEQSVKLAEDGLDVVKKMEAQGTVSEFDVLMAEVRLANMKPRYIEAKAASELSFKMLNNLIGLAENENTNLIFDMDSANYIMPELDLDSLKTASIESRPEIKMMRFQSSIMKKAISIAKAGYRPSVNFMTSFQFQAQYDANRWPGKDDWIRSSYSAIAISIPIFDSWRTPSKVKQAKLEYAQAELTSKELEENVKLEIEQNWWNYKKARESLATQGRSVEMAKRGLEIARVRYENGVGTQLELFESEVALAMAETNKVQAFYNLVTGYASLQKALGEEKLLR